MSEKAKAAQEAASESTQEAAPNAVRMVMLEIPLRDDDSDDRPAYFAINGKKYYVRKGEPVEVPDFVKEVYDNSRKADTEARRRAKAAMERYESRKPGPG